MGNSHKNLFLWNQWTKLNQTCWKLGSPDTIFQGATQRPFHQSLVAIGPVVSEKKIKMWNVDGQTKSDGNSSHGQKARWAGDDILKKSSPLKLLSQSQPNFAEMILGWSPSKIVSGISDLRPRWPPQPNLIYLSKFGSNWATHRFQTRRFLCEFPIGSYVKLSSAVGAIMVKGPNRRTHFWKITFNIGPYGKFT
jgi:hypothetical protein